MKTILSLICFCAAAMAQPGGVGVFPPPTKPMCTATRTTNCTLTDVAGTTTVPGTLSVTTTVCDGRELVATCPPYSASANNVADDAAALQACINASATAGKPCFMPAGKYRIGTTLTLPSSAHLRGAGSDPYVTVGTMIIPLAGFTGNILENSNLAGGNGNIRLYDFTISGNKANCPAQTNGIYFSGAIFTTVERVVLYQVKGISVFATGGGTTVDWNDIYISGNDGVSGMKLLTVRTHEIRNLTIEGVTAASYGALQLNNVTTVKVSNFHSEGNTIPLTVSNVSTGVDINTAYLNGTGSYSAQIAATYKSRFSNIEFNHYFSVDASVTDTEFNGLNGASNLILGVTGAVAPLGWAAVGGNVPAVATYTFTKVATGGACTEGTAGYGCFRVTGITTDKPATNAATLVIPFLAAPAKAFEVGPIAITTTSACTGPATAVVSDIGTANSATFFKTGLTHDLKTTAYSTVQPTNQGNDLATAQDWTLTITADGGAGGMNKDLAAGCAWTISVPWMVRP